MNQGVKRLFKRGRPGFEGTRPHRLRTPSTTSFPSGHASAAFCAAAILSGDDPARAPLWYGLAATVALSRPYVHIHHASDMVGGAVIGYALGRAAAGAVVDLTGRESAIRLAALLRTVTHAFDITWDYRCPFARNAHEHVIDALEAGADWDVTFVPFSLGQVHVAEGQPDVWDDPESDTGLLALQAGVVVRDKFPDKFLAVHRALFALRHDEGLQLKDEAEIRRVLDGVRCRRRRRLRRDRHRPAAADGQGRAHRRRRAEQGVGRAHVRAGGQGGVRPAHEPARG